MMMYIAALWPFRLQGCLASTTNSLSSTPAHKFLATALCTFHFNTGQS